MTKKELSIIIVSYNTKKITQECLNSIQLSLENSSINYEIIVVDNASTDSSQTLLKKLAAQSKNKLRLIINPQNFGFGKANNQAAKQAEGKYLLFLNSDIIVLGKSISRLLNYYQQHEAQIGFLGGRLLNSDLSLQPSAAWFFSLPVVFAALFLKGDYYNLTRFSPKTPQKVDWVSGACILTTKDRFLQIQGFDEKIFMYMEEVDLLYRAKKHRLTTYFYPLAQFIHLGSASSNKTYPILQVFQGLIFFYKTHYSRFSLFLLKYLLKLKALSAILIGKIIKNNYLTSTYEKAYQIVNMA